MSIRVIRYYRYKIRRYAEYSESRAKQYDTKDLMWFIASRV